MSDNTFEFAIARSLGESYRVLSRHTRDTMVERAFKKLKGSGQLIGYTAVIIKIGSRAPVPGEILSSEWFERTGARIIKRAKHNRG